MTPHDPKLVREIKAILDNHAIGPMEALCQIREALQSPPAREECERCKDWQKQGLLAARASIPSNPNESEKVSESSGDRGFPQTKFIQEWIKRGYCNPVPSDAVAVARCYHEWFVQAARAAQSDVVRVKRETWEEIKKCERWLKSALVAPGTWEEFMDKVEKRTDRLGFAIKSAEGDVSKNRQNLNISERHNEKSDDSQYVSVPKDAFNELIRLVKYEAVVALEQSRMSVSLVEDIRNAIKAAEGES